MLAEVFVAVAAADGVGDAVEEDLLEDRLDRPVEGVDAVGAAVVEGVGDEFVEPGPAAVDGGAGGAAGVDDLLDGQRLVVLDEAARGLDDLLVQGLVRRAAGAVADGLGFLVFYVAVAHDFST